MVPLGGEKNFMPRPRDRVLVTLKGSFQNSRRAPPSFFMGVPSTGQQLAEIHVINFRYIRFSFRQQMFRESQRRQRR